MSRVLPISSGAKMNGIGTTATPRRDLFSDFLDAEEQILRALNAARHGLDNLMYDLEDALGQLPNSEGVRTGEERAFDISTPENRREFANTSRVHFVDTLRDIQEAERQLAGLRALVRDAGKVTT